MNRSRKRHGDPGQNEPEDRLDQILSAISQLSGDLNQLALMIAGADWRAQKRSQKEKGLMTMLKKEFYEKLVVVQTAITDGVAANGNLITKMIDEIRKAHDDSGQAVPPEVEAVLAGFEANKDALAAATAAGTAAFPADLPIPPVVEPSLGGT